MPPRGLPGNANIEQLRNGAKSFQRAVRAGDAGAAEVVREFHPRLAQAQPGSPELAAFKRADAAARALLDRDPEAANRQGGPFEWAPLLYLTYSRLGSTTGPGPGRDALETARVLLDHGADPNAGYLWEGLSPPFTALTGAFGSGEGDPPAHPDELALARLLLEAGADPNDEQTLYNRDWDSDVRWLALLFEFGLGTGEGGPWHRLLSEVHATPRQMVDEQLMAASRAGFTDHVRLLLEHGADPEAESTRRHDYEARTPREEAMLRGYRECAEMLKAAGARSGATPVYAFLEAATSGDRKAAEQLLTTDPALANDARHAYPDQLVRGAQRNSVEGVALLIDLGFDVNAINRLDRYDESAPLHEAAAKGNLEMIELLLANGADPNLRDGSYQSTAAGWAEHFGQTKAERYLRARES